MNLTESQQLTREAMAHLRSGKLGDAEGLLRRVVTNYPEDVPARLILGSILTDTGRSEIAVRIFREGVALASDHAMLQKGLGNALRTLNQWPEAERRFRMAIVLDPAFADACCSLGDLMTGLGRTQSAIDLLDRALRIAPDNMLYWSVLSKAKRFRPDDPHLATLQTWADRIAARDEASRLRFHFALGKAYDDVGAFDDAFAHILAANRLKRRLVPYDEAATLTLIDGIRDVFTPALLAAKAGQGDPTAIPVFVIGMPRSGGTLIAQILASHPDCTNAGETTAMGLALADVSGRSNLGVFPHGLAAITGEQIRAMASRYLQALQNAAQRWPAKRVIDKMPANAYLLGLIHLVFPKAKIIHTTRDPRDACLSAFFQNFEAAQRHNHDLGELGRYWRAYEGLMTYWLNNLPAGTLLQVPYEDVVADGEEQTRRILEHCELPWDDACLAFHESTPYVLTAAAAQVRQPLYRTSVGRWRNYAAHLGPLREALGV